LVKWFNDRLESFDEAHEPAADAVARLHAQSSQRKLLTRPSSDRIFAYRAHVDAGLEKLLSGDVARRSMPPAFH
jgi:hypothetical protein